MRTVICPGSFDPVTNGHLDIIERSTTLFDKVIVAVSRNPVKQPLFTIQERVEMLKAVLAALPSVEVDSFSGLTVYYAVKREAQAIMKGLRVISDFENEFRMALTNKKLVPEVETVFLMTKSELSFISSSAVKEVASYGGCVRELVPPLVEQKLKEKFGNHPVV